MPDHKPKAVGSSIAPGKTLAPPKAPHVPDALPLLDDELAYLIPRSAQHSRLRIDIDELWGGTGAMEPGEITTVEFYWDNEPDPVAFYVREAPYGSEILPATAYIPVLKLDVPGLHQIRYIVDLISSGNKTVLSHPVSVNIDKEAPNQSRPGQKLIFPPEVLTGGITEDYLADHGDQVIAIVPRWPDMRLEDKVEAYWERLPFPGTDFVTDIEIEQRHKDGAEVELVFKGDIFRAKGNGEFAAFYYLTDRAGNISPSASAHEMLHVNLTPSPINLPPPRVPQADDGQIDLDDARSPGGVYMLIERVDEFDDGDVITPFWNGIRLPVIIVDTFTNWPIRVPIDWVTLSTGNVEVTPATILARYTWRRGTATKPSDPRFVRVDLTVAGPVNPENPNPVNRLLLPVTVKGVTGDNIITSADIGRLVPAVVPLYADPKPGQTLELMWAQESTPVDIYTVKTGDQEHDEVEFSIPWHFIQPIGNAVVQAYYRTFNGVNRQHSRNTPVNVSVVPLEPQRPEFPDVSYAPGPDSGFINCSHLPWLGVRVKVPGDPVLLAKDDIIELSWAGYASPNGQAATVIPETVHTFIHQLTAQEALNGYVFTIPFDPYVKLPGLVKPAEGENSPKHGSAVVRYWLKKATGGMGQSRPSLLYISLIRPSSPPCLGDD